MLKYLPYILAYNDKGKFSIKQSLSISESSIADDTLAWTKHKFILLNMMSLFVNGSCCCNLSFHCRRLPSLFLSLIYTEAELIYSYYPCKLSFKTGTVHDFLAMSFHSSILGIDLTFHRFTRFAGNFFLYFDKLLEESIEIEFQ